MTDQYTLTDPRTMYADIDPTAQKQPGTGLDAELKDRADLGEKTYRGSERLAGRKALITGGDSGIGGATAIAFAREGADVAISYLPEEQRDADYIAEVIEAAGRKAVLLPGDVTDRDYVRQLVADAHEQLGGLDILVSNAGKQQYVEHLVDLPDEQFEATLRTNVEALFWITKAARPLLAPGASIIATSSSQAYQPTAGLLDYASSKGAINVYAKALAQQLAPEGIRVNLVAPGPVWTPLQTAGGQPTEALPEFGKATPLGRPGQPAEVAPAYVFLASQESSFVVGTTIHVNGGKPTP